MAKVKFSDKELEHLRANGFTERVIKKMQDEGTVQAGIVTVEVETPEAPEPEKKTPTPKKNKKKKEVEPVDEPEANFNREPDAPVQPRGPNIVSRQLAAIHRLLSKSTGEVSDAFKSGLGNDMFGRALAGTPGALTRLVRRPFQRSQPAESTSPYSRGGDDDAPKRPRPVQRAKEEMVDKAYKEREIQLLADIKNLLLKSFEQTKENFVKLNEQAARAAEASRKGGGASGGASVGRDPKTGKFTKLQPENKQDKSIFDNLGSLALDLAGLGAMAKFAMPLVKGLGTGALVAGAALLGWEIGKQIDKFTGASDRVAKAANWWFSKMTGQPTLEEQEAGAAADARQAETRKLLATFPKAQAPDLSGLSNPNPVSAGQSTVNKLGLKLPHQAAAAVAAPKTPPAKLPVESKTPVAAPAPAAPAAATKTPTPKIAVKDVANMRISDAGLKFIQEREESLGQVSLVPRPDNDGNMTIGYGMQNWKGKSVLEIYRKNPNFRISKAEADAEFHRQMDDVYGKQVRSTFKGMKLSQGQYDALVSGAMNFTSESRASFLGGVKAELEKPNGDPGSVFDKYVYGQKSATDKTKVKMGGLVKRRQLEKAMFNGPSAMRDAGPVEQGTSSVIGNRAGQTIVVSAPHVNAPTHVSQQGMVIPVPIRARDDNPTLRGLKHVNNF